MQNLAWPQVRLFFLLQEWPTPRNGAATKDEGLDHAALVFAVKVAALKHQRNCVNRA